MYETVVDTEEDVSQKTMATSAIAADSSVKQGRSRWKALVVLCIGMLMIVLDSTVVNVALTPIQNDLGFTSANLAWVMNAYLITFGGLLLLAGRLGDLVSRRGVFLTGLGIFTAASLLCGMAQSQQLLIAARFVQGVGGALTSAVILGMIVTMFPEPRERAKAIGIYAFTASAGGSIGLIAGGVLTQLINWHWIFFINIPIGIVTALFTLRLIRKDKGIGFGRGTDFIGAVLITGALSLAVYTVLDPIAEYGWGSGQAIGFGVGVLALLAAFVVREATARTPLIPLRVFRARNISGSNATQLFAAAGMFGVFFVGVLYLQRILGYDALQTGLAFLPTTIMMGGLSARYSERLVTRFGAKATLLTGLLLIAAGLALFARVPVHGNYVIDVLPPLLLLGTGAGSCFPAVMTLAMSGTTNDNAGLASGLANTTMQFGASVGLAVLATLSTTRSAQLLQKGETTASALTAGYQLGMLVAAGFVLAAALIALVTLRSQRQLNPEAEDELDVELV